MGSKQDYTSSQYDSSNANEKRPPNFIDDSKPRSSLYEYDESYDAIEKSTREELEQKLRYREEYIAKVLENEKSGSEVTRPEAPRNLKPLPSNNISSIEVRHTISEDLTKHDSERGAKLRYLQRKLDRKPTDLRQSQFTSTRQSRTERDLKGNISRPSFPRERRIRTPEMLRETPPQVTSRYKNDPNITESPHSSAGESVSPGRRRDKSPEDTTLLRPASTRGNGEPPRIEIRSVRPKRTTRPNVPLNRYRASSPGARQLSRSPSPNFQSHEINNRPRMPTSTTSPAWPIRGDLRHGRSSPQEDDIVTREIDPAPLETISSRRYPARVYRSALT